MILRFSDQTGREFELFKYIIWADQVRIGLNAHRDPIADFDAGNVFALLVHQEVDHSHGGLEQHFF